MKTTNEIKQWIKQTFGFTVVGNTSAGKSKWQGFRIRPDPTENNRYGSLSYSHSFPADFRKHCLGVVYGVKSSVGQQTSGGNINSHSISMMAHEWETVIATYQKPAVDNP